MLISVSSVYNARSIGIVVGCDGVAADLAALDPDIFSRTCSDGNGGVFHLGGNEAALYHIHVLNILEIQGSGIRVKIFLSRCVDEGDFFKCQARNAHRSRGVDSAVLEGYGLVDGQILGVVLAAKVDHSARDRQRRS